MRRCDVLIAGGGIAGASLGCLLATRTDLDVVVIEASDRLGGRARSVPFAGGVIDCGLHALLLGKRSSLFTMGKAITHGLSAIPLGARVFQRGRTIRLFSKSPLSILTSKGFSLSSLIAASVRALRTYPQKALYRISLNEFCERFRVSEDTRDFLRCISIGLLVNACFHQVSFGEILAYLALSAKRAAMIGYPEGGWNSIWRRFTKILGAKEGRLRLQESLLKMQFETKRVTACITDQETYLPERVVLAVPPQSIETQGLIPSELLDSDTRQKLRGCRTTYGLNVDLLLEGEDAPDYVIFTLDPPTLAFAPPATSPELIGHSRHVLTIFTPLGTNPSSELEPNSEANALVDLYCQILPGLKERILTQMVTVLPVTSNEVTVESNYLDRPPIECPSFSNLYMIGDWVKVPGVGGERAFASALECYRMLASSR